MILYVFYEKSIWINTFGIFRGKTVIEKQREKEFLFELERLYHNYNLVVSCTDNGDLYLMDADCKDIDKTTTFIERYIDEMRDKTLEDVR